MIFFKRLVLLLGCLCLLIGISGCGDKPATLSVRLPVTVNGKVPEGAQVTLHPQGGAWSASHAHRPFGKVGADGTVQFSTFASGDGVPPGEYAVSLQWPAGADRDSDRLGGEQADPARPGAIRIIVENAGELPPVSIRTTRPLRGIQ